MVKQSVYPTRSQEVTNFFSQGVLPEKLLIIPIDFAKSDHLVHFCRGTGEFILNQPLTIYNTLAGADYLEKRIGGICRKYHLSRNHILIGGEDPPSYVFNFIHRLKSHDFKFVRVNAHEAKKFRANTRASSDSIDLNGIAQAMLNRRARDIAEFDEIYAALKSASRNRRKLVKQETAFKNQIHKSVDILFPGFLSETNTQMVPFSQASLWLMEENFSSVKIKRMRMETLVKGLRRNRATKAEETAKKLKQLSESVLVPPPDLVSYSGKSLATKIVLFRAIRESIKMEETEMARCLVQTPGFYFTSFPGIGIVLAGGIMAEYGDWRHWPPVDNMASYAGIVPRQKQTGGIDNQPLKGHLPVDCNRILKDWLLQGAYHVGTTKHPMHKSEGEDGLHRLLEHYRRVENNDGKSRLSTAKLLIKIGRQMVFNERIYLPSDWVRKPAPSEEKLFSYLEVVNKSLDEKWKSYDLSGIDQNKNSLIQWRNYCDELMQSNKK